MSEKQTLKFTIRQDGTVLEEVSGVIGKKLDNSVKAGIYDRRPEVIW